MTTVLELDIDRKPISIERLAKRIRFVLGNFALQVTNAEVFETEHGYHVYITLDKEVDKFHRIFLQLACGSDWKRETFNYARAKAGAITYQWMFRGKEKHDRELSKRLLDLLKDIKPKTWRFIDLTPAVKKKVRERMGGDACGREAEEA